MEIRSRSLLGGGLRHMGKFSWCYAFASRPFSPWHVASLVAPMDVLYFPLAQSSHVASLVAPVDELYFPSPQSSHVASLVAPVDVLYFPSPQSSHVETPVEELNFPAAQSEQEVAPTALNVPAEQGSQSELEAPPDGL